MRRLGWLGDGTWLRRVTSGRLIGVFALLLIATMTVGASLAHAASGFGIESYSFSVSEEGGSADTQVGSHPYELTAEAVLQHSPSDSEDEVRTLIFELPPGLIFNPLEALIEQRVGEIQVKAGGSSYAAPVETLRPAPGEFGALRFTLNGVPMSMELAIRGGGNYTAGVGGYGMTVSLHNIPHLDVESVKLILDGKESGLLAGQGFMLLTLPTSCDQSPQSTLQTESWGAQIASRSSSLSQMTGCSEPTFNPALGAAPDVAEASIPSGYELSLQMPQNESRLGVATAQVKDASIALPGVSLSLSSTNGLEGCTEAQFALSTGGSAQCPNSSKIGIAEIRTPLLAHPLEGALYLATPNANPLGALFAVYVAVEDSISGILIKLAGEMALNQSTGQATLRFDDLPQLPISEIALHLFGGQRALLANPPVCGSATASAALTPWNGGSETISTSTFEVSEGADGGSCEGPAPFHPKVRVEPSSAPARGSSTFLLSFSRELDEQDLARFSVQLPAGVAWNDGEIQSCDEPAANEGTCPSASQIGTAIVSVGPSSGLAWFTGPVYLTGGYRGGESGVSIVLNATAGPFDLGELVLRVALDRSASSGALVMRSDPLPRMIDGVLLQMKALEFEIERQGLILYPATCEELQTVTTVESVEEASEQATTPFDVEGCETAPTPSTSPPPTGKKGRASSSGHQSRAKSASKPAIFHVSVRVSGKHLMLRFRTAVGGKVSIAGHGVRRYVRRLRAGVHEARLELSAFGVRAVRDRRSFALRLTLRRARGSSSATTWVVRS